MSLKKEPSGFFFISLKYAMILVFKNKLNSSESWRPDKMKEYTPFKSGKVREVYDAGDSIIMVATDRISAFDHILKNKITKKGAILTQMSK